MDDEERKLALAQLRRSTQRLVDQPAAVEMTIDATTLVPPEMELSLRTRAVAIYMASSAPDPFEDVMADPSLSVLGAPRLQEWARLDCWDLQRREMQRRVTEQIRLKLLDQVTDMKIRDLEDLGKVIQGAKVLLKETPPKSWEGVAKVLLAATNQRAAAMEAVMNRVAPEQGEQKSLMEQGADVIARRPGQVDLKEAAAKMLAAAVDDEDEEEEEEGEGDEE